MTKLLNQYGREKKAAWEAARRVLAVASETQAQEGYPGIAHDLETMRVAAGTAMRNIESLMCGYPDRFPQHAFEGTRDLLRDALAEIERKPK